MSIDLSKNQDLGAKAVPFYQTEQNSSVLRVFIALAIVFYLIMAYFDGPKKFTEYLRWLGPSLTITWFLYIIFDKAYPKIVTFLEIDYDLYNRRHPMRWLVYPISRLIGLAIYKTDLTGAYIGFSLGDNSECKIEILHVVEYFNSIRAWISVYSLGSGCFDPKSYEENINRFFNTQNNLNSEITSSENTSICFRQAKELCNFAYYDESNVVLHYRRQSASTDIQFEGFMNLTIECVAGNELSLAGYYLHNKFLSSGSGNICFVRVTKEKLVCDKLILNGNKVRSNLKLAIEKVIEKRSSEYQAKEQARKNLNIHTPIN